MPCSFLFVPRMQDALSNCFINLNQINQNKFKINFCYFNPMGHEKEKYSWLASPEFLLSKAKAREFSTQLQEAIVNQPDNIVTQKYLSEYNEESELAKENLSTLEQMELEQFSLNNFSNQVQIEDMNEQINPLILAQQVLLLEQIQEKQVMDLYILEQKILEQNTNVQEMVNNSHEKKMLTEDMDFDFYEDFEKNSTNIQPNFKTLNGNSKTYKENILKFDWQIDDVLALEYPNSWQKIFISQLNFIQSDVFFIINDKKMGLDLLNLTKSIQDIKFIKNICDEIFENKDLVFFQNFCKNQNLNFSLLEIPLELISKKYSLTIKENKKLSFLIFDKILQ